MKLYNFKRLIRKYGVAFMLKTETAGGFVAGKWEGGTPTLTKMKGAIVPLGDRKIYSSGGTYTTQDRQLYLTEPLGRPLSSFKVLFNGDTYAVEEDRDYALYADVAVYVLKRVDVNA